MWYQQFKVFVCDTNSFITDSKPPWPLPHRETLCLLYCIINKPSLSSIEKHYLYLPSLFTIETSLKRQRQSVPMFTDVQRYERFMQNSPNNHLHGHVDCPQKTSLHSILLNLNYSLQIFLPLNIPPLLTHSPIHNLRIFFKNLRIFSLLPPLFIFLKDYMIISLQVFTRLLDTKSKYKIHSIPIL